jgi:transmembrane protein 33
MQRVINHLSANRIETVLWITRLFSIFTTINFFLPIFGGHPYSSYQRVLLSNAATSALRLHQRVPNFQFSRAYIASLFLEDSAHYLFFSLVFLTSSPVSMSLMPIFLFAVLHAQSYTKQVLNQIGPNSLQLVRSLLSKIEAQQTNILRFIACSEIFLMPTVIFLLFTGQGSFLLPFLYYRFLALRYSSRRNPYCRQLFTELRLVVETFSSKPQCPQFVRGICLKGVEIISRLAPAN